MTKSVKKLLSYVREYKRPSILTPLFMLLEVAMEMVIPLLMASIIDDGVQAGNMHHILVMGVWMLLMALIGLFGGVMGGRNGAIASAGFAKNLRKGMFENIQRFSFSNIDRFSSSSLITRMTTDVTNVQNAYQMVLRMGTRAPASLLVAMALSFSISPRLAMIYLVIAVIIGVMIALMAGKVQRVFNDAFTEYDHLNRDVQENIAGIRVVKAYVREDHEKKKFRANSQKIYNLLMRAEKMMVIAMPVMMVAIYTSILLISWNGAHYIIEGSLTTGELLSLLTYCMNILISMMMLAVVFVMILMSSASIRRINEVLTEEPTIVNPENPIMEVSDGSIDFNHVSFSYSQTAEEPVLKDINLHIKAGETVGIIGATGSAKTTLVSMIPRLYDVTEGSVFVGGNDTRRYDLETLRGGVSMVLQQNLLFSGTIYENLRWGDKNATDEECREAARLACADEFIEKFPDGYDTYIEQGGTNVSGGQRQRLCIARALLKKPKILILDDSTSAVDTTTDAKIRQAFRQSVPGMTRLIIAQRVSSVMDADRIIVLKNGEIDGFGTHEELLESNEIYRDIYESQTGAGSGDFDAGREVE